ncbi:hypothetical protein [Candidatus Uabimicrobium amorphum]|uniref:Uncharacterized protein n=1 Tax=Uabimicrobium amorphum TaxID=2596890 RepID=A0A5S9IRM8_UABAM|nr:hypothetical protein [Candidatus Uabimicrobium amorphum]BBM86868.1 hypothetical protein UABAM_05268 [Candidatus Uabimicrobium amorphum]
MSKSLQDLLIDLDRAIHKLSFKKLAEHYSCPWNYQQKEIQNIWQQIIHPCHEEELKKLVERDDINIKAKRVFTHALDECGKKR